MVNKLTKQQVVGLLIGLRHKMIDDCAELDTTIEKKWLIPDCLEWAINFIEKHEESNDTIKLPYKEKIDSSLWRVLFRTKEVEGVLMSLFSDEPEADAFIAQLKENKQ